MPYKTYTKNREGKKMYCMMSKDSKKEYCYPSAMARKKGMMMHESYKSGWKPTGKAKKKK